MFGLNQARIDIKASLNALPTPKNNSADGITEDQIARLEAEVLMFEKEEKSVADQAQAQLDEEERQ